MEIKINEKSYPVHFGVAAIAEVYDLIGFKFTQDGFGKAIEFTFTTMLNIAYVGIKHGARKAGQKWDLSYEETCDLFDEDFAALNKIIELFGEAQNDSLGNGKGSPKKGAKK